MAASVRSPCAATYERTREGSGEGDTCAVASSLRSGGQLLTRAVPCELDPVQVQKHTPALFASSLHWPTMPPLLLQRPPTRRDVTRSASKPAVDVPTVSVSPTTVFIPETVAPAPPPPPPTTTVVVTSVLAPPPPTAATAAPTAVFTTVTQVLSTVPFVAAPPATAPTATHETHADMTSTTFTTLVHTTTAGGGGNAKSSPSARSTSSARIGPSAAPSTSSPHAHKAKSNIGKYVGYAIGGFFLLLLVSSFFSAWRKHRKYVRKRPRGSIFIGSKLSDGESTPPKRSMAQTLRMSVSNSSFDAYALCRTPPATPLPVYRADLHPESLQSTIVRGRGGQQIRPLPPTPTPQPRDDEQQQPSRHSPSGSSGG
ncbi:C2H2-type domain-containing protein [Mycena kentingensis (nom. inval.)]|nr:C2H2-type domain-containing protein [Mycena kentingensis (nom. inval.)]